MKFTVMLLAVACLASHATANRQLLQALTGPLPTFNGLPLTVTNAADPAATQTTVTNPSTGAAVTTPPAASALPTQAARTPGQAPAAQPPTARALPVVAATTPTPAPAVTTPVLPAPTPAPVIPLVLKQAPTPAPANAMQPRAPVPAPVVAAIVPKAPVPAPQVAMPVPVPAPAPGPLECGVRPQCRVFVEDMLCCESAGAINNRQHLVMRLQCTHPVNYYPRCVNVSGPTNVTAFNQFDTAAWSRSHAVQVNFLQPYVGNATIDIQGPRTNANLSADCGLYITPCMFEGNMINQVDPVMPMSFTTLDAESFLEVASPVEADVSELDNLVMPNMLAPNTCMQQNLDALNATFFESNWVNYTSGFQNMCNFTAFTEALALAPATGSVATASLG